MDKKTIGLIGVIVIFGLGVIACCILGAIAFSNTRNPEKIVKGIISNPKALKELSVALEKQKTISEKKERKKADTTAQKKAITPMRVIPPKPSNTSTVPKNSKDKKNNKNSTGSKNKKQSTKPLTMVQTPKKKRFNCQEAIEEIKKEMRENNKQLNGRIDSLAHKPNG